MVKSDSFTFDDFFSQYCYNDVVKKNKRSFHFNQIKISNHPEVYEPAEDTFLLLDAIDVTNHDDVFEIGTGTGIIAIFCAQQGSTVLCSDINPYALELVKKNWQENQDKINGSLEIRKGSLFSVLQPNEQFSLIIFNPPYLPTKKEERIGGTGWYDKAVSGGMNGLKVTSSFLLGISDHLMDDGRAFTIFSTKSPRTQFNEILEKNKLKSNIVNSLSYSDETIEVHRITTK